jgi:Tol biopolymer transport system component
MKNIPYKLIHAAFTFFLLGCIIFSCNSGERGHVGVNIPYPLPRPDSIVIPFLPGLVSTDSVDFGSAFSLDGKSFYFTRSENKRSRIYVTHHDGQNWTASAPISFGETRFSDADPAIAPDGKLYFISNRPKNFSDTLADYDIWVVAPLNSGRWSEPENMKTLNSDSSEFYISFSRNGNLYFSSSRKGGFGELDIYVSRFARGSYTDVENLGTAINSNKSDYDPGISANEEVLVFTSSNREDTFGAGDLYGTKLGDDKSWLKAVNLGRKFNTRTRDYCAYFPPDSKYFFFTSEGNVKWISVEHLKKVVFDN